MLLHAIAPQAIAERLALAPEELSRRRATILQRLKPTPALSGLPAGARAPLDYERPHRRFKRQAV